MVDGCAIRAGLFLFQKKNSRFASCGSMDIIQIGITSMTSHVMKSYLIRRQYWLDDFIHEEKDREIFTGTSYGLDRSYSRS